MRKVWFVLMLAALTVTVSGCGGGGATATPTTAPPPTPTPEPVPTSVPTEESSCQTIPMMGQPINNLPPVTAEDWVRGPADASVTLIEYADFQ